MAILKVRAKVRIYTDDELYLESLDMGNLPAKGNQSETWGWRNTAVLADQIYELVEYGKGKTLMIMLDGKKILVSEAFDSLFDKWKGELVYIDPSLEVDGTEEDPPQDPPDGPNDDD
jgi:hypothetical protein